jgi:hypothetical protein
LQETVPVLASARLEEVSGDPDSFTPASLAFSAPESLTMPSTDPLSQEPAAIVVSRTPMLNRTLNMSLMDSLDSFAID